MIQIQPTRTATDLSRVTSTRHIATLLIRSARSTINDRISAKAFLRVLNTTISVAQTGADIKATAYGHILVPARNFLLGS